VLFYVILYSQLIGCVSKTAKEAWVGGKYQPWSFQRINYDDWKQFMEQFARQMYVLCLRTCVYKN
jgi:hypothetical protein